MRSIVLLGVIILVLAFALAVFVGSSDKSTPTWDLRYPHTLLPIAASGFRTIASRAHEWVDATTAGLRKGLRHEDTP